MSDREKIPPSHEEMELLRDAQRRHLPELLRIPGVHGVGIGYKVVDGERTDQLALVVRVHAKRPKDKVDPRYLVPERFRVFARGYGEERDVVTDVQQRPRPVPYPCVADHALEARVRPIPGGYSISGDAGGTLGGWVWDEDTSQTVLISNEHVLGSTAGRNVLQPSFTDGGSDPADHFADVLRSGTLDCAIAAPRDAQDVELEIEAIGPAVYETTDPILDMQVEKSGQTTEHTTGEIVLVNYASGHYGATNDFECHPDPGIGDFAYYGDSGALIVERTHPDGQEWKRVVGLLWGGDPGYGNAYAHPIEDVFADLGLITVCGGVLAEIIDDLFAESYAQETGRIRPTRPWRPEPDPHERARPQRFFQGIGRDLQKRIVRSKQGARVNDMLHVARVPVIEVLRERETQRAVAAAMVPFVRGAVTVDDVMERVVEKDDAERFARLIEVVGRRDKKLGRLVRLAQEMLKKGTGRRLGELFE